MSSNSEQIALLLQTNRKKSHLQDKKHSICFNVKIKMVPGHFSACLMQYVNCMQVLLCSLLAPMCFKNPIPPCQKLCEAVRNDCSPVMEMLSYPWPDMLNCSRFPSEEKDMCININQTEAHEEPGVYIICIILYTVTQWCRG